MSARWLFAAIGAVALLAGTGLWLATRPPVGQPPATPVASGVTIAPGALLSATFADTGGRARALGEFQGKLLVLNFWATWCAPCREEMPAFSALQARWAGRGVQFVGLANESSAKVHAFGESLGISYPLWTGGDEVAELARRLGNAGAVLPYTALVSPAGAVLETKVGPYTEAELERRLSEYAANTQQLR